MKVMADHNVALLGKAIWHLLIKSEKLWVEALSHKYLQENSVLHVPIRAFASPVWRGLMRSHDSLRDGFKFRLGKGSSLVWYRDWTGQGKLGLKLSFAHILDTQLCLKDLVLNNSWNLNRLYTLLPDDVTYYFSRVSPTLDVTVEDNWAWCGEDSGIYTVRSGYSWIRNARKGVEVNQEWKWIWKLSVPEKV